MIKKIPVINPQSALSITPPLINVYPSCSAFKARFKAVKNKAPNGATKATQQVIMNKFIYAGEASNLKLPTGPRYKNYGLV